MGFMMHHTIVVSSCFADKIATAQGAAAFLFGARNVSSLTAPDMNGFQSFFVAPDGSKEGWSDSDDADAKRRQFTDWLDEQAYEDGSNGLRYVEVSFGADEGPATIVSSN